MKKFLAFIFITLIASTSVFAEESKLIDFNTINGANTEIDISTDAQSDQLIVSLNIDDWRVILNSSANSVSNQSVSTIKTSTVNGGMFAGESVLGARIHFPVAPVNAWGLIKPPFEIPAYYGAGGSQFMNNGVVINVGTIKEIRTYVYGLNYPHSISVILEDHTNKEKEYFLGSLEFDGWRQLTWQNPAYIEDVRNRELSKTPLYPFLTPYAKLVGFRIYRDETHVGGDFITYIKDVDIIYDQALLETQRDIDDETIWGIIETRGDVRTTAQNYRLGERLRLESQEREKQDVAQQDIAQQDAAVQQDAAQQDAAQQDTTQQ